MAAPYLGFAKRANDVIYAVRRLIQDVNPRAFAVTDSRLRALLVHNLAHVVHAAGWSPWLTENTAGVPNVELSFSAGEYTNATGVQEVEMFGFGAITTDRSDDELAFLSMVEMQHQIDRDIKVSGAVLRGAPTHWSVNRLMTSGGGLGHYWHLFIYPAADVATKVKWNRTNLTLEAINPHFSEGRYINIGHQLNSALELKMAADALLGMTDAGAQGLGLDRQNLAMMYGQMANEAIERERQERAGLHLYDCVSMGRSN